MTTIALHRPSAELRVTLSRVLRMEWIKFWSLRSTVLTLAITALLTIGIGALVSGVVGSGDGGPGTDDFGDPTAISLSGVMLAALAMAALGVLMSSGEYASGMIRATLAAVPARLPVLWAKAIVFAAVSLVLMFATSVVAFLIGQEILSSRGLDSVALSDPGVFRAVAGASVYLTGAGLIGLALGALLRNTAGATTTVVGLLFVFPLLIQVLPASWYETVSPVLPSNAAGSFMAVETASPALSPWPGLAVFAGYVVVLLAGAAVLLRRRDG